MVWKNFFPPKAGALGKECLLLSQSSKKQIALTFEQKKKLSNIHVNFFYFLSFLFFFLSTSYFFSIKSSKQMRKRNREDGRTKGRDDGGILLWIEKKGKDHMSVEN